MSTYTKEQLNARMAEVMGWKGASSQFNSICCDAERRMCDEVADYVCMDCGRVGAWNPTEDANQALMVLEKWVSEPMRKREREYNIGTMRWEGKETKEVSLDEREFTSKEHIVVGICEHASIPVAICLAVASAEDGQQATLEEV